MKLVEMISKTDFTTAIEDAIVILLHEYESNDNLEHYAISSFRDKFRDALTADRMPTSVTHLGDVLANNAKWENRFKVWLPHHFEREIRLSLDTIITHATISEDQILLFRAITAPDDWYPKLWKSAPLGIHWSFLRNSAYAHWGNYHHSHMWLIEGWLDLSSVDWAITLSNNVIFTGEDEIRAKPSSIVHVIEIYNRDENQNNWVRARRHTQYPPNAELVT